MQTMTVLCVGKLKESYLREACAEYVKRLGAFCRIQVIEVDEARMPQDPSPAHIAAAIDEEGKRLLARIPESAAVIALCIEGKMTDSVGLSEDIARWGTQGRSHLVWVIGGSWGLSDAVKARADRRLSMSPMTFPHQLARVMLLEQLYRACQILHGGKYHK